MTYEAKFDKLVEKIHEELEAYEQSLMTLSPRELIDKAEEINRWQETAFRFDCLDPDYEELDEAVLDALLKTDAPLAKISREMASPPDEVADLEAETFINNAKYVASFNKSLPKDKGEER